MLPVVADRSSSTYHVAMDGRRPLEELLRADGACDLSMRTPVVAYGANRNPATVHIKLQNYGAGGPVPVLRGRLAGADVVACGLHGQGYLYGELLLAREYVRDTTVDVFVLLLDDDQLRAMNDSEGLTSGMYSLAAVPGVRVEGVDGPVRPLAYVANERVWISPELGSPIAYSAIAAGKRVLPGMAARQVLHHAIQTLGIADAVADATGLDPTTLADDLPKYMNGQWWYEFHTGDQPLAAHGHVLDVFSASMRRNSIPVRTLDQLSRDRLVLPSDAAYAPGAQFSWGALVPGR
ncbi:hypothetical protein JOD57_000661 [Geodermatophilus bullaregiensis]|uniref:hypothetical protein n=1 Tax=Geodermatophilus bullaregiensis TaxID=1564160 RepID=UPI00195D4228|nr:hypothetical protein [Geodermatophilus bullaregiensis]MBM7804824.1 hypothetical protein [Geodermatophilus bullaregiensis]